jgi:hypothetical protein
MSEATQETFVNLVNKGVASELARKRLARDQRHVNEMLYELGRASQVSVPLDRVNEMLASCGFDELEPMLLCGREGRLHEPVGRNRWLALSWYKMESGRYEVIAYVS